MEVMRWKIPWHSFTALWLDMTLCSATHCLAMQQSGFRSGLVWKCQTATSVSISTTVRTGQRTPLTYRAPHSFIVAR